jgi:RHS repeat-associated protein
MHYKCVALRCVELVEMGCQKLTYNPHFELIKNGFKTSLTSKNSSKNLRRVYFYGFNGMQKDDEIKGQGNSYDFGARMYDSRVGRWLTIDPKANKYPDMSPYNAYVNNPIYFIDPDGEEPIKPQAGTIAGFVKTINTTGTYSGIKTGVDAANAMKGFSLTKMEGGRPMPQNTQRINTFSDKYIYTEKGGWIDMAHFMFYAGLGYNYKLMKEGAKEWLAQAEICPEMKTSELYPAYLGKSKIDPLNEAVQDGYMQEMSDRYFAPGSAYSYEDLPSDNFGADFGANYFDPNSKLTLGQQLENYFNEKLGATNPESAPNYKALPKVEPSEKPSSTNHTVKPKYTIDKSVGKSTVKGATKGAVKNKKSTGN